MLVKVRMLVPTEEDWLEKAPGNFLGDETVICLILVVISRMCAIVKSHWPEHLRSVHFTLGKLCLDDDDDDDTMLSLSTLFLDSYLAMWILLNKSPSETWS